MPLKLDLGSVGAVELAASGDLSKHLQPGIDSIVSLSPLVMAYLDSRIADVPAGSVSTDFSFSFAPSWKIAQTVGITLSVKPKAGCTLSIIQPGGKLFNYAVGQDAKDTPVKAPADGYYIGIALECSLAVDAGAKWSSGNLGVSGNISTNDKFRVANYYRVAPSVLLRDAISQAFSNFVLPFHAGSIAQLPPGDYVDFEFIGNLALGFGATYGFSGMFFGGRSQGEVSESFATPIGKSVISAKPSFQVGAGFKLKYTHDDAFRVVTGRTTSGATLYLLRKDASGFSTTESFGVTLNAGVKFQTDAATVKAEARKAAQGFLAGSAGSTLGDKLNTVAGDAVNDINDSVNKLLAKGNGQKIALELMQSRTRENTALFVYNFDFSQGTGAYDVAMRGDYAAALTMPGVNLDPQSYVEQLYTTSAGLNLQFFDLFRFQDVTDYIRKTDISYLGSRTFQIRKTAGVKSISGLFGKNREADLYFIAQCRNVAGSTAVSAVDVRLNAIFTDRNNASAFEESVRMMGALGLASVAASMRDYVARRPTGTVQFTLDVDTAQLRAIDSDDYQANGKPAAEPHLKDKRNYEQFVESVTAVIGSNDDVAQGFEQNFATYADWLAFHRVATDRQGSTGPGDRLDLGDTNGEKWPPGYPPTEKLERLKVQTYIVAGQEFMNLCDSLKHLIAALPGVDTEERYDELYDSIAGMIRNEISYPAYFLKPSMAALTKLAGVVPKVDGTPPDPHASGTFALTLTPAAMAITAGGH